MWDFREQRCVQPQWAGNCGPNAFWNWSRGRCAQVIREGTCPIGYRWSPAWETCVPAGRSGYCRSGWRWDWDEDRCAIYAPPPRCDWGYRFSFREDTCVPWNVIAEYPTYRDEDAVGVAIIGEATMNVVTAMPLPDYTEAGFGYFAVDYGDDTRTFMEESASRAMIDYMTQMNYTVDPDTVQVLNTDTRGTLDAYYVAGTAKLQGDEDIYWLVRTTTDGNIRVLYIRSDQYGDFVTP